MWPLAPGGGLCPCILPQEESHLLQISGSVPGWGWPAALLLLPSMGWAEASFYMPSPHLSLLDPDGKKFF